MSYTEQIFSCKTCGKIENRKTASKVWFIKYYFLKTWPPEDIKTPKEVKFLKKKFWDFFQPFGTISYKSPEKNFEIFFSLLEQFPTNHLKVESESPIVNTFFEKQGNGRLGASPKWFLIFVISKLIRGIGTAYSIGHSTVREISKLGGNHKYLHFASPDWLLKNRVKLSRRVGKFFGFFVSMMFSSFKILLLLFFASDF